MIKYYIVYIGNHPDYKGSYWNVPMGWMKGFDNAMLYDSYEEAHAIQVFMDQEKTKIGEIQL